MKKILIVLLSFGSISAFAGNCKIFVPSFDVQYREGTDRSVVEREQQISNHYRTLLESELSIKGYTVLNVVNFDFNGTIMGVDLEGYDKTLPKCLFTLHLREFKTYDLIGAPAAELMSEKYYYGKSNLGLFPKKEMPDCSKAWSRAISQIERCPSH